MSPATSGDLRDDGGSATTALSDRMLFHRIAAFQSGYPGAVAWMARAASEAERRDALRGVYTLNQQDKLIGMLPRLAVVTGDLQTLRLLFGLKMRVEYERDALLQFVDVMQLAVRRKRVDVLECLAELKRRDPTWEWESHLMSHAATYSGGDLRVLEWLHTHLPSEQRALSVDFVIPVVRRGSVDEVRWFVEHGYSVTSFAADCAASSQAVQVLEYLYQHTSVRCSTRAAWESGAKGSLAVVKIVLAGQSEEICVRALECAARYGYLHIVAYLVENGLGATSERAIDEAASRGRVDVVRFLHERIAGGCSTRAMDSAAYYGYLEIVEFLHANRSEGCTTRAMDDAAANNHLDVVKFLHANRSEGCSVRAMDDAASYGSLEVVRFLHENRAEGCSTRALESAVAKKHLEVVAFLCAHRSESDISAAMASAASAGHLDVVKILHSHRRRQDAAYPALKAAAQKSKAEIVRFLFENQQQEQQHHEQEQRHHVQKQRQHQEREREDDQDHDQGVDAEHHSESRFLSQAVAEGTSWAVQAMLPYSTMVELREARALALSRQDSRVVRVLDRGIRELVRAEAGM